MTFDLATLVQPATSKILLVVLDGLAGYATADRGTELEEAETPNLDELAAAGLTGLLDPVGPGITPGSGPAHLSLFGYDPFDYHLGRGALSAAGLDVHLNPGDVAPAATWPPSTSRASSPIAGPGAFPIWRPSKWCAC